MPIDDAPRILGFIFGISVVFLVPFLLIRKRFPRKLRLAVLSAAILSGVILFAPMTPLQFMAGLYQLKDFKAPLILVSVVFSFFIITALLLGRSFCGYACPYGALMSLAAWKSLFRIQRTLQCTGCGACEAVCPTGEYQHGKQGNECYLCSRCQDICSVTGGIEYQRRGDP